VEANVCRSASCIFYRYENTKKKALEECTEVKVLKKRDTKKLEVAQKKFLRPSVGIARLDSQQNTDVR